MEPMADSILGMNKFYNFSLMVGQLPKPFRLTPCSPDLTTYLTVSVSPRLELHLRSLVVFL